MATSRTDIRRRQGSKHDKTGCLTCRHRRKKCTENTFPVCGTCARLNIECVRQPVRNVVPASRVSEPMPVRPPPPLTSSALASSDVFGGLSTASAQRRHAMRYYITVLTQHVSVSEQHNSFLSAFLPMAMESKALADSIIAWASGHLAATDESYGLVALETHSSAISALSSSLSSNQSDIALHETNAAACLVLLISEICRGDRAVWYNHLLGAKSIIESAQSGDHRSVDAIKLSGEGQWVLRNFAYHDILASVTLGQPPLLNGTYLEGIIDVIDSCVGVATSILKILAEICALEHRVTTDDWSDIDLRDEFLRLEMQLAHWNCPAQVSPDLASVAYAYRSAAEIVLFRTCRNAFAHGYCPSTGLDEHLCHNRIAQSVTSLLDAVAEIPLKSLAESALVFPLFIAGGDATIVEQQSMVRMRLQSTLELRQFQNITRALEILETLWVRRETIEQADWKDVLAESGGGLILT